MKEKKNEIKENYGKLKINGEGVVACNYVQGDGLNDQDPYSHTPSTF